MNVDALVEQYDLLRARLARAYAIETWDSEKISRIADQMAPLELALARSTPDRDAIPPVSGTAIDR